ncbi:AaceriAAL050Wp [[Ashbya] aceris (nom. inval.)]|nr:AaceriAAL050Wp [[Ashbya] aceris (nom. inval.)]
MEETAEAVAETVDAPERAEAQVVSKNGPFRSYLPSTIYRACQRELVEEQNVLLKYGPAAVAAVCILCSRRLGTCFAQTASGTETEILEEIHAVQQGGFHIGVRPPLVLHVLAKLGFELDGLRRLTLLTACIALEHVYKSLRCAGIQRLWAGVAIACIALLQIFQDAALRASLEVYHVMFVAIILHSWKSFKLQEPFGQRWWLQLSVIAVCTGLAAGTKFIGLGTWAWVLALNTAHIFQLIGDLEVPSRTVWKHALIRLPLLTLVPLGIILFGYHSHLQAPSYRSRDSAYMPTMFKAQLEGYQVVQPASVYYGSEVVIRHSNSLGGYLHSHELAYPGGSEEQQITLADFEDANNQWTVEPVYNEAMDDIISSAQPVRNGDLIKLRHVQTGKLLRASAAKPPVSQQDYDQEVSCTGDSGYSGDSDETWRIDINDAEHHEELKPVLHHFSLVNKGQSCTILSHDVRLPEWGLSQQEVICLSSPVHKYSLFYVDSSQLMHNETMTLPKLSFLVKFWTYVQAQHKYDYFVKNSNTEGDVPYLRWLLYISENKLQNYIWAAGLVSVIWWLLLCTYRCFTWNPWDPAVAFEPTTLRSALYRDNSFEYVTGWFIHYIVFSQCSHGNLQIVQYLPGLLFTTLQIANTFQTLSEWISQLILKLA